MPLWCCSICTFLPCSNVNADHISKSSFRHCFSHSVREQTAYVHVGKCVWICGRVNWKNNRKQGWGRQTCSLARKRLVPHTLYTKKLPRIYCLIVAFFITNWPTKTNPLAKLRIYRCTGCRLSEVKQTHSLQQKLILSHTRVLWRIWNCLNARVTFTGGM